MLEGDADAGKIGRWACSVNGTINRRQAVQFAIRIALWLPFESHGTCE